MIHLRSLLVCSLLVFACAPFAHAKDESLVLASSKGLTLDGRLDEAWWQGRAVDPQRRVEVVGREGRTEVALDLRLAAVDSHLVVGVQLAEDPGTSMGLHLFVAPEKAKSAAEALSIDFRPVELRAPRLAIRGPRGVGLSNYPARAAADWTQVGRWSAEVAVPLGVLPTKDDAQAWRVAVMTYTRTPNVAHAWPKDARWKGPSTWQAIRFDGDVPSFTPLEANDFVDDATDRKRLEAWLRFLKGSNVPVPPAADAKAVSDGVQAAILGPLDEMLSLRPDLAVPLDCLRGDIHLRLGRYAPARVAYERALKTAPGWREAAYGLHVKMARELPAPTGQATAYASWRPAVAKQLAATTEGGFERDGWRLRQALLSYMAGDFDEAIPVLDELAKRYPHDAFLGNHAMFAKKGKRLGAGEARRAEQDAKRKLPRVQLETTKGTVVFELLEDASPNTVNNFVYLAQKGFYDGVRIHRTVPGFLAQTGDGLSKLDTPEAKARVGAGTAGYAIRTELNDHALVRGMVAMANAGPNTESAQWFITTGTAVHLQGDLSVFGRVLEGQDVAESWTEQDRIRKVTVSGLDPERRYHPTDASGRPAPEPTAR